MYIHELYILGLRAHVKHVQGIVVRMYTPLGGGDKWVGGGKVQGGMQYEEDSDAEGSESEESVSDDNPQQTHTGYVHVYMHTRVLFLKGGRCVPSSAECGIYSLVYYSCTLLNLEGGREQSREGRSPPSSYLEKTLHILMQTLCTLVYMIQVTTITYKSVGTSRSSFVTSLTTHLRR